MNNQNVNKHTINFTDEDELHLLERMFIDMIIDKHHPEIVTKAKTLAKEYLESQKKVEIKS